MQYNKVFIDWLKRCHISDFIISEFKIHTGTHPALGECIVIPVCNGDGSHSFNKYRRSPLSSLKPKYISDTGSHVTLFAQHLITPTTKTVLITEGEKDTLVAWSHNIPAVTSTGGSLSFKEEWAPLFNDKEVIICYDNDIAGGEGMVRTLAMIPHAKLLFLPDRANIKDISDYTSSGGDLNELIKTAYRLSSMEEVMEDRAKRLSKWQSTYFHDAFIDTYSKPAPTQKSRNTEVTDKLLRAKEYPISNLVSVKSKKTKCLWHNDTNPSMHYYEESNNLYCFSCGKYADSIEVYRELYKCTFKEAVEKLQ